MELTGFYTRKGLELQAELAEAETGAVVTRVMAGSGETAADAAQLAAEQMEMAVGKPHRKGGVVTLPATLAEAQAEADFALTEAGVYVRDTDGAEVLCRVYRLSQPLEVTAGGRSVIRLELEEAFGETAALAVEGTSAGLLTEEELDARRGVPGGIAALDSDGAVPMGQLPFTFGTDDLTEGETALKAGTLHFVYEE